VDLGVDLGHVGGPDLQLVAVLLVAQGLGGLICALTLPALTSTVSVATTFLPSFRRRVSVPASETSTLTLAALSVALMAIRLTVGAVVSPSSKTVGAVVVVFGSAGGRDGSSGSSQLGSVHGVPGSTGAPGSVVPTTTCPFMPPGVRPPWIEQ
jgi:hypothetical protein